MKTFHEKIYFLVGMKKYIPPIWSSAENETLVSPRFQCGVYSRVPFISKQFFKNQ